MPRRAGFAVLDRVEGGEWRGVGLPKRKTSKSRRDKRRTHYKVEPPRAVACPQCGEAKLPHRVCPNCGYYGGRQVLAKA